MIFSFTRRLPTRKLVQKLLCLAHVVPGGPEGAHPGLVHDCRAVSFIRAPESWRYFLSDCLLMIGSGPDVSSYIEQIVPGVGITCHLISHCVEGSADVRVNFVSVAVIW